MSPLDSILGLEGLFIEQVQRAHDIHVWARPRKRACCVYCANPRVRIKATYTRTLKHTRQGNQLMWLHLRVPKYHCLQCNRYFRHRIAGVRPRQRVSEMSGRSCPQVLGIDEHFFSRKRGYATTFVDLKNHKVFDVVLGRSEASLTCPGFFDPR